MNSTHPTNQIAGLNQMVDFANYMDTSIIEILPYEDYGMYILDFYNKIKEEPLLEGIHLYDIGILHPENPSFSECVNYGYVSNCRIIFLNKGCDIHFFFDAHTPNLIRYIQPSYESLVKELAEINTAIKLFN